MAYQTTDANGRIWQTLLTANDSACEEGTESLGAVRELSDGRRYRYIKMTGSAGALGSLYIPATLVTVTNVSVGSTTNGPDGATTTLITDSDATWTTDAYIGWYFKVDTGKTGSEEVIKIVGNTATTLTLEKQLSTTVAALDDGKILAGNGIGKLALVDNAEQPVIGVGIGTITENYYGWAQVRGMANVISTSALTENQTCSPGGTTTAGQAKDYANAGDNIIGITIAAGTGNTYQAVELSIA